MVIKRIEPLSLAKLCGILYAIMGLIFGCVLSVFAVAGGFPTQNSPMPAFGMVLGVGAIFFLPIFYGGLGFVFTFIGAALYNVIAGIVGGVELEVQ